MTNNGVAMIRITDLMLRMTNGDALYDSSEKRIQSTFNVRLGELNIFLHDDPENEHDGGQRNDVWEQDPHAKMLRQITGYPGKECASHAAETSKKAYCACQNAT